MNIVMTARTIKVDVLNALAMKRTDKSFGVLADLKEKSEYWLKERA